MITNCVYLNQRFEWDERKRHANLEKHGLDCIDVIEVFEAPHLVVPSTQVGDEKRFLALGCFNVGL